MSLSRSSIFRSFFRKKAKPVKSLKSIDISECSMIFKQSSFSEEEIKELCDESNLHYTVSDGYYYIYE